MGPYLSPFYSPLIYPEHRWCPSLRRPSWSGLGLSATATTSVGFLRRVFLDPPLARCERGGSYRGKLPSVPPATLTGSFVSRDSFLAFLG